MYATHLAKLLTSDAMYDLVLLLNSPFLLGVSYSCLLKVAPFGFVDGY